MEKKLFHGSCHCGKIKFQANLDLVEGTGKCNCTFCRKNANWSIKVAPQDFELITGEESIAIYTSDPNKGHYVFCKQCGTLAYGVSKKTDWSEEGASVKIASLDDMTVTEMASLKINYYNGKDNTWAPITDQTEIDTMY